MGKTSTVLSSITRAMPQVHLIEASKLRFAREAPANLGLQVRKSADRDAVSDAELEALIRHHGVLIPITFKRHAGEVYVTAGNRRLRIVRKIDGEGSNRQLMAFDSDEFDGDPRAIAMATNSALPMHPVDRYEVISSFAKEKISPKDIQERFGLSQRQYAQTMRLAGMAPVVREAWRNGEINAETAQAFALSADAAHQEKVFNQVRKDPFNHGRIDAHSVRMKMVGNQSDVGPMVEFLGVAECVKGGVSVNEDLFGTLKHTVSDVAKLKRLAATKLEEETQKLVADHGWAWAVPKDRAENQGIYYGRIDPAKKNPKPSVEQQKRIEAMRAVIAQSGNEDLSEQEEILAYQLDQIEEAVRASAFTPEQRAKAGCFLQIGRNGALEIEYGRVKPAERKKVEAAERRKTASPAKVKPKATAGGAVITNALADRLSRQLTQAIAVSLPKQPQLALAALVAGFGSGGVACEVKVGSGTYNPKAPDFAKMFEANKRATIENLAVMLAQVAGQAINFHTWNADSPPMKNANAMALCQAIDPQTLNVALRHAFDAKGYFSSVSRDAVAQAVREAIGEDQATKVLKMKSAEAAKFATANIPATGWLPVWLRSPHYDGPRPTEAKKTAKKRGKA